MPDSDKQVGELARHQPVTITFDGNTHCLVPKTPSQACLRSMAIRSDHGLGVPGYYDSPLLQQIAAASASGSEGKSFALSHEQRMGAAMIRMSQLYEEAVGQGFFTHEAPASMTQSQSPASTQLKDADLCDLYGVDKSGRQVFLGRTLSTPKMKAREILRDYGFTDFADSDSESSLALEAMNSLVEWMTTVGWRPPEVTLIQPSGSPIGAQAEADSDAANQRG